MKAGIPETGVPDFTLRAQDAPGYLLVYNG